MNNNQPAHPPIPLNDSYVAWRLLSFASPMDIANFTFTVFTTSALIACIHSPLNAILASLTTSGNWLPPNCNNNAGSLTIMRALYTGFAACFTGVSSRTSYMTGAKKLDQHRKKNLDTSTPEESGQEKKTQRTSLSILSYTAAMSLGDTVLCQAPEALNLLKSTGTITPQFKWFTPYNLFKLSVTGSGARFSFSFINFVSICEIEQFYSQQLPIVHAPSKHFIAGLLSGVTAAILGYPFAHSRDYHVSKMTVQQDKLVYPGRWNLFIEYKTHIKTIGFRAAYKEAWQQFSREAPIRALRAGVRFGIITGGAAYLGATPVNDLLDTFGLFPKTEKSPSDTQEISQRKMP